MANPFNASRLLILDLGNALAPPGEILSGMFDVEKNMAGRQVAQRPYWSSEVEFLHWRSAVVPAPQPGGAGGRLVNVPWLE